MHLSILHTTWPPAASVRATSITLPWDAVAAHVSHRDVSGDTFRSALRNAGCSLECIELPPLTCLDAETFERETDDAYMRLQIAERVGAPLAIIASAHEGEAGFEMTVDALTRLTALAERMDVRLVVRNACGSALEQPAALHELLRRIHSPDLAICVDALEFAQALVNPADAALSFSQYTAAVCLPARPVPNLRVTATAIRTTLTTLAEEDFTGPVIVEAREAAEFQAQFQDLLKPD
ncbi:MAG TPA: TIM barrel protein [Phycisphaerae bacterium]|mgnify:CR=1 FL=1|nr:TIM barrel protein [Phycisphaerae bacterium]